MSTDNNDLSSITSALFGTNHIFKLITIFGIRMLNYIIITQTFELVY